MVVETVKLDKKKQQVGVTLFKKKKILNFCNFHQINFGIMVHIESFSNSFLGGRQGV